MKVMPNLGYCLPEDSAGEPDPLLGEKRCRGSFFEMEKLH